MPKGIPQFSPTQTPGFAFKGFGELADRQLRREKTSDLAIILCLESGRIW
ncbi:MAG: hypothetical protein AB2L24_17050 [Mangrovibacterium sp.]